MKKIAVLFLLTASLVGTSIHALRPEYQAALDARLIHKCINEFKWDYAHTNIVNIIENDPRIEKWEQDRKAMCKRNEARVEYLKAKLQAQKEQQPEGMGEKPAN